MYPIALIGSFTAGLSMSNQQTILFYLIPIILSIFVTLLRAHELSLYRFLLLFLALLAGLLPYAYLVVASVFPKIGNWGDMRSLQGSLLTSPSPLGFLSELLRSEYGTFQLFSGDNRAQKGEMFLNGLWRFAQGLWQVRAVALRHA